ncbi:MAG: dTMP kinase [Candidatus Aminicenantes bacterium]|nr:dTMP kinase [Candidatus Aminicenantes bacterium]
MKMVMKKGILIVFEGIDGSGKSVQAKLLQEKLKEEGFDVVSFQEPSDSQWGREIKKKAFHPDSLSPEEELDLFVKDRRENVERNLRPALQEKKVVILDRYYFSTISYQGARGIDPDRIRKINEEFAPKADLVFILDIDARSGLNRIKDRKNKERLFEREDYLAKVDQIFRSLREKNFIHLDALEKEEQISQKIAKIALDYLRNNLA